MAKVTIEVDQWLADFLKLWKDTGEKAPRNELQSIFAWLSIVGSQDSKEVAALMRKRMALLLKSVNAIHKAGPEVEDEYGIYIDACREEFEKKDQQG